MKRIVHLLLIIFLLQGVMACNHYRSINTANKVSSLSGNPFYHTFQIHHEEYLRIYERAKTEKEYWGKFVWKQRLKPF